MGLARCDEHKPEPLAPDHVSYALPPRLSLDRRHLRRDRLRPGRRGCG